VYCRLPRVLSTVPCDECRVLKAVEAKTLLRLRICYATHPYAPATPTHLDSVCRLSRVLSTLFSNNTLPCIVYIVHFRVLST
jgi:hypothetical protein